MWKKTLAGVRADFSRIFVKIHFLTMVKNVNFVQKK